MPFMKCQKNNKSGWKYGAGGHCYTGKQARQQAGLQAKAIHTAKYMATKGK